MMRPLFFLFLFAGCGPWVLAGESIDAQALYQRSCTHCHQSEVMTRPERKVRDLAALRAQVRRCDANLGLKWFDEDIEAVSQYLNQQFYRFPAKE